MGKKLSAALVVALIMCVLLSGCGIWTASARLDKIEDRVEHKADAIENYVERKIERKIIPSDYPILTKDEVEAIALEHADLSADDVKYLRTEYDIDDGVPEYEVQFSYERWEYNYDIHAETGVIRSFEKDD